MNAPMPGPVTGKACWTPDDWRFFVAANPGRGPAALGRLCGKTKAAVSIAAQRYGLDLPDGRKSEAHAERAAEVMRRLHAGGTIAKAKEDAAIRREQEAMEGPGAPPHSPSRKNSPSAHRSTKAADAACVGDRS